MIIDPYQYEIQMALFQSTNNFDDQHRKSVPDIVIKNIMYCTQKKAKDTDFQIKLITQYTDFISQPIELKEEIPSELTDTSESESHTTSDDDSSNQGDQNLL